MDLVAQPQKLGERLLLPRRVETLLVEVDQAAVISMNDKFILE